MENSETLVEYGIEHGEMIFSSSKTLIQRATIKNTKKQVVIKKSVEDFASFAVTESIKRDYQFSKILHQSYPEYFLNMIQILEQKNGGVVLIMEDMGLEGLQIHVSRKKKIEEQEFLELAKKMTRALHFVHSKQILHRDIKLANFVYNSKTQKLNLIDFGLSTMVTRKSPSVSCHAPTGTFNYMSPEQTGRVSKNVDFRSDLYSLGISFYELLTGDVPFKGDLLALVHAHITKKVPYVKKVNEAVNKVIQKLCSKNPSERYKSALGVLNDLEYIQKNLDSIAEDFKVGQNDIQEFLIPNKLYGREEEIESLKADIMEVKKSNMCLVSGVSGMGKSKLVEELLKDQELKLLMAYGKFDQFNRLTPFSAFIKVMKSLIAKFVSETEEKKKKICQILKHELCDTSGGVLCSIIPEIELLIGKKKIPEPLSTVKETQERLFNTMLKFLNCFTEEVTLVVVLDDLQWADAASFQFLETLLKSKNQHIFIIGAYRNNEVGESHPLMSIMNEYKSISSIQLQPLKLKDLNRMVADTLFSTEEKTLKLSELIHKKTLGNPFFSREFINTLYEENLIQFQDGVWNWDVEKVEKMNFSSNVVDFMVENLKKQPRIMQKLLNRAACIGNTFKIDELNWIWDEETKVEDELVEPVKDGWIHQINSNEYQFYHDRLQQAAYELYDEKEREKIHLVIGQDLLEEFTKQDIVEQNIFSIINHLNAAKSIFTNQKELLKLNVIAAKESLKNSAFSASLDFSKIALELLPEDSWNSDYTLTHEVHSVQADTCYANSLLKESEDHYNTLLEKSKGRLEKLTVCANYMKMASLSMQYDKAYSLFAETFKMFDFTKDIPFDDAERALSWTLELKSKIHEEAEKIGGMKNIHQLKPCTDDEIILLLKVIFDSLDVMYLAPSANPLIVVMATLTSLYMYFKEGLTFNAALGLSTAGWIYLFFFKDNDGKAIMANAEKLLARDKNPKYNVVATQFFLGATCIFAGNLKQQVYYLDSALKYAQNHGEYLFGAYSAFDGCSALSLNGENFNTLIPKLIKRKAWLKQVKNFFFLDFVEGLINLISDLAGVSKWNPKFIIPNFESIKCADTFVPTVQGILAYHKGDYENALTFFQKAEPFNNNMLGFWDYYESKFYHCMCMIYFYKMNGEYFDKINQFLEEFKPLGENGSEYLAPRYRLMELYFQSVESQDKLTIISSLEELLDSATTFGLIIVAAMISEIILEICDENKMPKGFCRLYFNNTVKIWSGLSAKTKVDQFKKKYYKYLSQRSSSNSGFNATTTASLENTTSTHSYGSDTLDMMSIIKASQALSVELTTSSLILKVMSIIIENTGAERCLLFLATSKEEFLESSISNGNISSIHKPAKDYAENEIYCTFLFALAKSIRKTIMISDVETSEYSENTYIQKEKIKSICIHPIYKAKKYVGTIYMENRTLEGIFDENRKEILEHISSQIAISFENAKLYDDVNSLNNAYERFLPKEFLNQLGKGDVRNIKIGDASTKNMSVLFSDIRSFTNITEKMNPEESFAFVNEILSYLAPIISKHNGFIDKFFGDCIMALFPYSVDDALSSGYEMQSALKIYNQQCRKGLKPVEIGIGIHFGGVMLGTIGAEERIDATVISDTVNTASRVESLTKTLGATFVVTDSILENSKISHLNRYIGTYLLQGKEKPMKLYQMLQRDQKEIDVELFTEGIESFESNNFKKAEKLFSSLSDKTSTYLGRVSKKYQHYVFDNSWNGEIKIDKDGNIIDLGNTLVVDKMINQLTKEQEIDIMKDLLNDDQVKDFLRSWSKQTPEPVHHVLSKFTK